MRKKIFISYDYENDKYYKNTLLEWDINKKFDFIFDETSQVNSAFSWDSGSFKNDIKEKINESNVFLLIVGEKTWENSRVNWEIDTAIELRKSLVIVQIDDVYITPFNIPDEGVSWALSFTFESIKDAIG